MSYDIYLFKRKPGENTDEAIKRIFSEEANEINPGLPDVQKERRKQYLASIDIQSMKFTAGLLRLCRPMCGKSRTCRRMLRKDLGLRPRCRGTAPICWSGNKRKATGLPHIGRHSRC